MPVLFGIPLIGWIQMLLGTVLVLFVLVKYLLRPKKKKTAGYLIRDVHVIVGDGRNTCSARRRKRLRDI